jgi:hypothetical protein
MAMAAVYMGARDFISNLEAENADQGQNQTIMTTHFYEHSPRKLIVL